MLKSCWFLGMVLATSAFLVEGCRSSASRNAANLDTGPATSGSKSHSTVDADRAATAHAHYAAGVIHDINEESEAALQEYYQAAIADPENDTLILEVSKRFSQNKQPEKALDLLTRAAARPNAPGAIFANLGFIYLQLGKQEQAIAANRTAIKKSPGSLTGYQNLFLSYLQLKQPQDAMKVLDEA